MRRPSPETDRCATKRDGVVSARGSPVVRPDDSSTSICQICIVPPRSLRKYSDRPSGAQTGFQSTAGSEATRTGVPPASGIVQISRLGSDCARESPVRDASDRSERPVGVMTSNAPSIFDGAPPSTLTTQSWPVPDRTSGVSTVFVQNTRRRPSGNHDGCSPKSVSRRADSAGAAHDEDAAALTARPERQPLTVARERRPLVDRRLRRRAP